MVRLARVTAAAAALPIAVMLATSSCELIAGIRDHTPLSSDDGGAGSGGALGTGGSGGAGLGGHLGAGGAATGGSGRGGMNGAGGSGTGGKVGTGGSGTGGGSGGVPGTGGDVGTGGVTGAGGASCVTTFSGRLLYSFDTSQQMWIPDSSAGMSIQTGYAASDGHTCPGAVTSTIAFTAFGQAGNAEVLTGTLDLTGRTALHAWVKILPPAVNVPGYGVLSGATLFVQSANFGNSSNQFLAAVVFSDGFWHEVVLNLATSSAAPTLNNINSIGVAILAAGAAPPGVGTPGSVTFLVDDVWAE